MFKVTTFGTDPIQTKNILKDYYIIRMVWTIQTKDIEDLRGNIERARKDSSYTIICNYKINYKDVKISIDPQYSLIVHGDHISTEDLMDLKEQIKCALSDPDYIIITNYEVHLSQYVLR